MDERKEERRKVWNILPHSEWLNCYLLPVCGRRNKEGEIYITAKLKPCYHSRPCTNFSRAFIPGHPALRDLLFSDNAIGSFTFPPYIIVYVVIQIYPWFKIYFLLFQNHYHNYHSKKQRKIKFAPRIKLNHDMKETRLIKTSPFLITFQPIWFYNG